MSTALDRRPCQCEGILAKEGPDSDALILLNPASGQFYTLEGIGGRVWELCDGSRTLSEVVSTICAEYDAPRETIEADILELLRELEDEGLVTYDS